MLDPHYGQDPQLVTDEQRQAKAQQQHPYASLFPTETGGFQAPLFEVDASYIPGEMRPPTFILAFENERNVLYAIGEAHAAFQYRVFDATTKEPLDRAEVCWRVVRGRYDSFGYRKTRLSVAIAPNWDSRKSCLPPGDFTPIALERMSHDLR